MTEEKKDGVQTNDTPEVEKQEVNPEEVLYKEDKPEDNPEDKKEDEVTDEKPEDKEDDEPEDKKDDEKSEDKKVEDKPEDKKEDEKPEDKPDEKNIELVLPENSLLNQERVDEIAKIAKEQGLSQEHAQMMVDREHDVAVQFQAAQKAQLDNLADVVWPEEAKKDPEVGGEKFAENVEFAKRAFKKFGSEKFNEILNESGYGNHPELIRTFSRIGKAMSNDTLIHGKQDVQTKKSPVDILYGGTTKKE